MIGGTGSDGHAPEAPAVGPSTESRVLRSTLAGYGIQATRMGAGFAAKLVLARLILPEATGVFEEALRVVTVLAAVRDFGLPYQLVRDRARPYGTAFWFILLSSVGLAAGLVAAAPWFAGLHADVPGVLSAMALWLVLDGLLGVPRAHFEAHLRIGKLVGPEVARIVAGAAVSVGAAAWGAGVWSLVLGELVGTALAAAWSWSLVRREMDLRPRRGELRGLLRRSSGLFVIWLVIQIVTYVDVFIVEAFASTASVGEYARAYWIAFLAASAAWPRAFLPTLVALHEAPERQFTAFRLGTVQLLGIQVVGSWFLALNAERVVAIVLGPEWTGAAPILRVLSFIPFFDQFSLLGGELLKARHEDRRWLAIMAVNLAALVGFGVLLCDRFGPPGMAAANYLLVGNLGMAWALRRVFGAPVRRLWLDLGTLYALPAAPFLATLLWPAGSWHRFGASIAAAAVSLALLLWRYGAEFRDFFGAGPRRAGAAPGGTLTGSSRP